MNKKIIIALFLTLGIITAGFMVLAPKTEPNKISSGKLKVAASFYPLYFFAEQIGGDKAEIVNITPAGVEPHDYEPTPRDIANIEKSRLLILNGVGLEAWGENIKDNIDSASTALITAGEGLATEHIIENGEDIIDPHIWLSLALAKQMVDKIASGFIKVDSANADYYQTNASALKSKFSALDDGYKAGLANCSQSNIITSHAAFGYLAAVYHLKQTPIAGLSPDVEPSAKNLGEIADFAKKNNVKYIFFESLTSQKLSETIAREVGARTLTLNPLEGLSDDDLRAGKNYFTEMRSNLANLRIALECK